MAKNRIDFQFLGDARDLINATRGARNALDKTETQAYDLKDGLKDLAIGVGAVELGQFAWDAVMAATKADEVAESARDVLGPALGTLRDNLDGVRGSMGLTQAELDTYAAKFGLMTESIGLTDQAQAGFVENLILTGGELAAFQGDIGRADEAIDGLAAAYRGEFDSLEQWGIKLSAAAVEAKKIEIAARDGNEQLSEQELELMAITELINEQAAPALGSLAGAQDSAAAKAAELNTKWEDTKALLGRLLSPALEWLLTLITDAVEAWERLTDKTEFWNTRLGVWYKKLDDFTHRVLEPFGAVVRAIRDAVGWLIEKFEKLIGVLGRVKFPSIPSWVPFIGDDGGSGGGRQLSGLGGAKVPPPAMSGPVTGGGPRINVNVEAGLGDPQAIAQSVVDVLQVYESTQGAVPITAKGVE